MLFLDKIITFTKYNNPLTLTNLKQWSIGIVFHSPDFKSRLLTNTFRSVASPTNLNSAILWFIILLRWLKTRTSYALNSWVYTTNHKRIAINYFNFVIVAGTAGMALATVIRLEFAYPGVGILAGDSIQYLSIATAHGVIMVFFMIMPAIFGAFGNFLLPTQLGVHDVAFPRLNSAAFWFLPGGLLMLCQLVCVDRRYQRMNCFNIRELQGILKRKFFPDLINLNDHRYLMDSSMIGLRFKYNNNDMVRPEQSLFYNFGTTAVDKQKTTQLVNYMYLTSNTNPHSTTSTPPNYLMSIFTSITDTLISPTVAENPLHVHLNELYNLLVNFSPKSVSALIGAVRNTKSLLTQNLPKFLNLNYNGALTGGNWQMTRNADIDTQSHLFSTGSVNSKTFDSSLLTMPSENTNSVRYNKYNNALVGYDYKSGHYLGIWDQLYPSLTTSFIEVSRSIRKAP